jgi:hypothetical protein
MNPNKEEKENKIDMSSRGAGLPPYESYNYTK